MRHHGGNRGRSNRTTSPLGCHAVRLSLHVCGTQSGLRRCGARASGQTKSCGDRRTLCTPVVGRPSGNRATKHGPARRVPALRQGLQGLACPAPSLHVSREAAPSEQARPSLHDTLGSTNQRRNYMHGAMRIHDGNDANKMAMNKYLDRLCEDLQNRLRSKHRHRSAKHAREFHEMAGSEEADRCHCGAEAIQVPPARNR